MGASKRLYEQYRANEDIELVRRREEQEMKDGKTKNKKYVKEDKGSSRKKQ
jgi:hypothetical protein